MYNLPGKCFGQPHDLQTLARKLISRRAPKSNNQMSIKWLNRVELDCNTTLKLHISCRPSGIGLYTFFPRQFKERNCLELPYDSRNYDRRYYRPERIPARGSFRVIMTSPVGRLGSELRVSASYHMLYFFTCYYKHPFRLS